MIKSPLFSYGKSIVAIGLALLLSVATAAKGATVERLGLDTVFVDGVIDATTASQISNLLAPNVRRLLVRSEGGRTDVGMDIGALIRENALTVEVLDYCMSSCANYIFLGANEKSVRENSIVVWHGGLTNSRNFEVRDITSSDRSEKLRELVFFSSRGVSLDIVIYSSILTLGRPTGTFKQQIIAGLETKVAEAVRDYHGWVPDKIELERLGVAGIGRYPSFESAEAAEELLKKHGFDGMRIFTGRAHSKLPSGLKAW